MTIIPNLSIDLQIVVWSYLHGSKNYDVLDTKNSLLSIVMFQYLPRLVRSIPLTTELRRNGGIITETAWAGAVYYLLWYMLASHVSRWSLLLLFMKFLIPFF